MVGIPGTGKTTYATAIAEQFSKHAYVIAHTGGTLPDVYPNGKTPRIKYHASIDAAAKAIRKDPSGINAIDADPSLIIEFGLKIAQTSLDKNNGAAGTPVLIYIDEVVAADEMNPYRLDGTMRQLIALRRHKNVGVLFTTQSPQLCHYQMFALATEVTFFRVIHEDALKRFRKIGIPSEIVDKVATLSRDKHQYIRWRDG